MSTRMVKKRNIWLTKDNEALQEIYNCYEGISRSVELKIVMQFKQWIKDWKILR